MPAISWLYVLGAVPFLILGLVHALYTFRDLRNPFYFAPRSPELLAAMQAESPRLTPVTSLWRAGLGFHFSHSLGVVGFAALYLWLGITAPAALLSLPPLLWAAPIIAWLYVLMAWRFWFRIPLTGALIGAQFFTAALIVVLFGWG
jgi:hypothetical protein